MKTYNESWSDVAHNGSTYRFVHIDYKETEEGSNKLYRLHIRDRGFSENHVFNYFKLSFPPQLSEDGIGSVQIFPVSFGDFMLGILSKKGKIWLF